MGTSREGGRERGREPEVCRYTGLWGAQALGSHTMGAEYKVPGCLGAVRTSFQAQSFLRWCSAVLWVRSSMFRPKARAALMEWRFAVS